jgi:antitoxin component YwqK of YwqJK toxin-antitoxin module
MTSLIKVFLTLTFFQVSIVQGQDLVKKKKYKDGITEEFFVLKENKVVRQGQSLTTYTYILDNKYVLEFGQYDKNLKTGKWLFFYYNNPSNFLKSVGNYKDDKKEGHWQYYFPASSSGPKLPTIFGSEKRTSISEPKKGVNEFQIQIDSSGQQLMSSGDYSNDKQVGVWEYFSYSGHLIHKFDYSSNELLQNNLREPGNDFITFLGGPERFHNLYATGQQEIEIKSPITKTSEVTYELAKSGEYKLIQGYGDDAFNNHVNLILQTIPKDWIYLDSNSSKKIQIISKVVYTENTFNRYKFSLDIKVIN